VSDLLRINVNEHLEKKNGLSYLSWAWAWAEVLKVDPLATWEAVERDGIPCISMPDGSALVKVIVTIKGHAKSCLLPVMNNRNQALKSPDAFAINTAIVRCLTKCVAMHGLGLYVYAGEDLPPEQEQQEQEAVTDIELIGAMREAPTLDVLDQLARRAKSLVGASRAEARVAYIERKTALGGAS
jgi:hypothetical protein